MHKKNSKENAVKLYFELVSRTPVLIASFAASMLFLIAIFPILAGDIESLDVRMGGYG